MKGEEDTVTVWLGVLEMSVPSYNHNCGVPTVFRVPISNTQMCKKLACNGATLLHVWATIISVVQSAVFDGNFGGLSPRWLSSAGKNATNVAVQF